MQRRFSPDHVARHFGVTKGTVIRWCESGVMPAVNVATPSASRKRWRMSEEDIEVFESRRANKPEEVPVTNAKPRRSIQRPTKDFLSRFQEGR